MDLWIINSSTIELLTSASLSQCEYHSNFVCSSFQWIIQKICTEHGMSMLKLLKTCTQLLCICIGTNGSCFSCLCSHALINIYTDLIYKNRN